ncbi:MAG: sulfotransferase family 2 domain-containing protein [Spirochaetaceae bacterium]
MSTAARGLRHLGRRVRERFYGAFDCQTHIIALHDYSLLYYAVPKVANTSLKEMFGELVAARLPQDFRERLSEGGRGASLFSKDRRPAMYERNILLCKHHVRHFDGYTGVAFVRNPWDRLVSCYANKLNRRHLFQGPERRGTLKSLQAAGLYSAEMSFADFVRAVGIIPDSEANRHFRSQYTFLTDRRGSLMPQRIYRFEKLDEDLSALISDFGLPRMELPHKKSTSRRDYREYYTPELRDMVAQRYADDIELFDYEF